MDDAVKKKCWTPRRSIVFRAVAALSVAACGKKADTNNTATDNAMAPAADNAMAPAADNTMAPANNTAK